MCVQCSTIFINGSSIWLSSIRSICTLSTENGKVSGKLSVYSSTWFWINNIYWANKSTSTSKFKLYFVHPSFYALMLKSMSVCHLLLRCDWHLQKFFSIDVLSACNRCLSTPISLMYFNWGMLPWIFLIFCACAVSQLNYSVFVRYLNLTVFYLWCFSISVFFYF